MANYYTTKTGGATIPIFIFSVKRENSVRDENLDTAFLRHSAIKIPSETPKQTGPHFSARPRVTILVQCLLGLNVLLQIFCVE